MKFGKYQLGFVHILIISFLLLTGLLQLCHKEIFYFGQSADAETVVLDYLPRGEYLLYAEYASFVGIGELSVMLTGVNGEDNGMGREILRAEMNEGGGSLSLNFTLKEAAFGVEIAAGQDAVNCLKAVSLQSVRLSDWDSYLMFALCLLGAAAIAVCGAFLPAEKYRTPMALVGMGLLCSVPLFAKSLLPGDDIYYHLTRIEGLCQGLLNGEFPVRINSLQNEGYGNLSATMYPQLFLYPAAVLRCLRGSLVFSYKFLLAAVNVATAFCSYYSVRAVSKSTKIAWVAAVLYTFSAYRLNNLYFRAALGETLAMVFLPLVFWGMYEVLWGDRRKWYLLMLGASGVLQSHVLSVGLVFFFGILEIGYWFHYGSKKEFLPRFLAGYKALLGILLLNAGFLVPFLYYSGQDLQCFHIPNELPKSVVYFSQMFSLFPKPEGTMLSGISTQGEMPLSVGAALLLGALLFLALQFLRGQEDGEDKYRSALGRHCLVYAALALFLASWLFPWEEYTRMEWFAKLTAALQFAWRFFGPASFFLSVVTALAVVQTEEKYRQSWVYGVFLLLTVVTAGGFFDGLVHGKEQMENNRDVERIRYSDSNYMYWEGEKFQALHLNYRQEDASIRTKNASPVRYENYEKRGTSISVRVFPQTDEEDELLFPLYYFPGYEVRINGVKTECYALDTLVTCRLPGEEALIEVRFRGFPAFWAADVISWLTMLGLVGAMAGRKILSARPRKRLAPKP